MSIHLSHLMLIRLRAKNGLSTRIPYNPQLPTFQSGEGKYSTKAHIWVYTVAVKQNARRSSVRRRRPRQQRSKVTVEAMLDAVVVLLKRSGAQAITTNRIAETAGVSIGSVYQYFPNKHALFTALHDRHVGLVSEVICRKIRDSAESSLEGLIECLMDGMIEAHAIDSELSELLQTQVHIGLIARSTSRSDFRSRFVSRFDRTRDVLAGKSTWTPERL